MEGDTVFYENEEVVIRALRRSDVSIICREERLQGWNSKEAAYENRIRDASAGRCIALCAEYRGEVAGYVNLYFEADAGPFAGAGVPEIVDFGVLQKFRCRGIGSRLIETAERIASERADVVCLGVGLHSGYGSAQRMYVKRGYVPDGSGVWYQNRIWGQYEPFCNDDDLVLYLSKRLKEKKGALSDGL